MRGIRTAGLGFAFAFATQTGAAQDVVRAVGAQPAPPTAARFGRISAVDDPAPAGLVRGQAPTPMPMTAPPAGTLGVPRAVGTAAPTVTEVRGPATAPAQPAASFGVPVGCDPRTGAPVSYPPGYPPGTVVAAPGTPAVVGVPSVLPGGPVGGGVVLDDPLFGGATTVPGSVAATHNRWQVSADYLLWFTKSFGVPTLLTTSTPASNGIIGNPDTRAVLGDRSFTDSLHSGSRFSATYWMGQREVWGLDGNVFFLGRNGASQTVSSVNNPVLARPFVNLNTGQSFSELVAFPGLSVGSATVNMDTSLWGAELNARRYLASNCCSRLDVLAGFRYMNLSEELKITESFASTPGSGSNLVLGTVQDQFKTENHFYGGQVGLVGEVRRGRWFANARGTVALGNVAQSVEIGGSQSLLYNTGPAVAAGGLLALPGANIGRYEQNRFAVMPEVGLQVGYHLTSHWRVAVGYNFLYLSSVLRPGDQIDTGLDVTRIPNFPLNPAPAPLGVTRPFVPLKETDFFAQGMSFSVQFTW